MRAPTIVPPPALPAPAPSKPTAPAAPTAQAAPAVPARDPLDVDWARTLVGDVIGPMTDRYFRARVVGAERIPAQGPLVLAANHSGNAFPYDGMVLDTLLWRLEGMRASAKVRTVYEHELSLAWWLRPFGIADFWRRGGGVDMTFDNFDRLLARGDRVLYFPEGVPGIGKGFSRRYQLQHFHTSFVLLAARHDVPVLPVYIVNGEWLHPFGYTLKPLDRLAQRVVRLPYLPLPLGLLALVLPWVLYLVFPARLVFVVGEPLDVAGALRAEGITELESPDRDALHRAADRIRARMQRELDANVAEHAAPRYGPRSLWRALRGGMGRLLPTGWPLAFVRLERDQHRAPARGRLRAVLRDWDLVGYYLPFGWVLLALARAPRRPTYGRRGLPGA
jgi:1-acyl-sn-glycerol-3-phosphate acyltransferase